MNAEVPSVDEALAKYAAALSKVDDRLLELLDEVAAKNDLSENETLALAIVGLWALARDAEEGRFYISVPITSLRIYDEPMDLLLGEARQDFVRLFASLSGLQLEGPAGAESRSVAQSALATLKAEEAER